mmetsp:Transcript_2770/g.10043  ORF Transcript_2770/g.10043 Transcript_2770/m.10043 type:complete len:1382 (-) Transcript_2770:89-4234(-)
MKKAWAGVLWAAVLFAAVAPGSRAQDAATLFGLDHGYDYPPTVTWLYPPKGHIKGGTMLTIYGAKFQRSGLLKVRFAIENEFDEVPATYISDSQIVVETPERNSIGTVQVTASNDGSTYSGYPLVYIKGSGTFLKFVYDNSNPGCLDCLNSADGNGLNPSYVTESWSLDNSTGPYIGGTQVTISASGLNYPSNAYDLLIPGSPQSYNGPVGGPGTPHPFNVDPTSTGNGPPVTGTFYPHRYLKCQWVCPIDEDQTDGTGAATPHAITGEVGVDLEITSDWIDAVWLDYTRIMCESPKMTVPGKTGQDIQDTVCYIKVSNNQQTLDELGNSYVLFTYQDRAPTVSNIRSSQTSVWPARGPFQGNTEVTVTGTNFLPSKYLKCKFGGRENAADPAVAYLQDDVSHVVGEEGGKVRYISSTEVICISPIFGPASQAEQYPPGTVPGSIGAGAILEVNGFTGADTDAILSIDVVTGGRGYATAPLLTLSGGGGCCASLTPIIDSWGAISSVVVNSGGKNYNRGYGATAIATISSHLDNPWHADGHLVVSSITITDGGSGYLSPPEVVFSCPAGGVTCFETGDVSDGDPRDTSRSPGTHARAVAVLGHDPTCADKYDRCQGQGSVVRIDIVFAGAYYSTTPNIDIYPMKPIIKVTPNEVHPDYASSRNQNDPTQVGYYSKQGKGPNELDPETEHGSFPTGNTEDTSVAYDVENARYPNGELSANGQPGLWNGRLQHDADDAVCNPTCPDRLSSKASDWKSCPKCPGLKSPEGRGPLLPPLGKAFMDGSIKPGHQALIRISNNYHKFGGDKGFDQDASRTHIGYRDKTALTPTQMGYWLWSESGLTAAEINRCRISNNPPVHQFGVAQGHGLDSHLGLGRSDAEHDVLGSNTGFRYLDGSSVLGGPGTGATAIAFLSDSDANCLAALQCYEDYAQGLQNITDCAPRCYVAGINVTDPGKGYKSPPTVTFSGGGGTAASPAHGARASAVLSGGTVIRVDMDPYAKGISYTTPPSVFVTSVHIDTAFDAQTPGTAHYIAAGASTSGGLDASYRHAQMDNNGTLIPNVMDASTVGHNTYNLDETALSVHAGQYRQTSNYDVGHGAFPGHPGNLNLGHPKKDCIYFLYSDIYVSPSGSDSTGQGTAGRPYRTIQKCIDAALQDPRDFYVYKRFDGGDRDPNVPGSVAYEQGARLGTESAGQRVDMTQANQNSGTGYDKGYTGRQVRYKNGRITGWPNAAGLYGQGGWEDDTRDTRKGFGYYINRDRCVLKDGTYFGEGNRELQPQGRLVELWAENANNATVDCGGKSIGKKIFQVDRHGGEHVQVVGSISMNGVVLRRCEVRADAAPNYRPFYPGRPGFGPGAKNPNGQLCWPGATGCQARPPVDGMAAGQ